MSEKSKTKDKKTEPKKYFIAEGMYVTSKKGFLKAGVQVFPKDFPGGIKAIEAHVKAGGIVVK